MGVDAESGRMEPGLICGLGAGSVVGEIRSWPRWTAAHGAGDSVWRRGSGRSGGLCPESGDPGAGFQPLSRCAAGPWARADVCSLFYAHFWEGRRGTRLRQPRVEWGAPPRPGTGLGRTGSVCSPSLPGPPRRRRQRGRGVDSWPEDCFLGRGPSESGLPTPSSTISQIGKQG